MQSAIEAAGETRKESGWVWLVWTGTKLAVTTTRNEDSPLMDDVEIQGSPIIAIDLWEHAYFLTYQARQVSLLIATAYLWFTRISERLYFDMIIQEETAENIKMSSEL